ncbi:MAG TPA: CDP-glycerol glycerophosphotransferase family protein [Cyclobacteriaceae bacterium]|nr:CDP-glycerol glycerophosphotransferase family protein [Cyclobacteriaceae bacterium]HMV07521.1 CDP-glycerol glycerophosphotransferase family protein [Cyclobacteriaceae bacterium]HMV90180.1 CDP-glycerol glycerophosphotransferase family protein [Cyclobacteriaceae bacterium]HMX02797.1 CDP-glycerol glycerophosphotransferase family protein [Cyclobacteriaceae bacterium]HMX52106.1 CDP-glycerol glycerophosphotransferase family protein [Cyclobacteriaceae bacterium]
MRVVLFCANPYAFGIMKPLHDALVRLQHTVLWYIPEKIASQFPFAGTFTVTDSMKDVYGFKSDAIFVPGNEVPHYLRGVKVQIFHGLAGEKQGHFRIRNYFDLYLTQGPYFTERFEQLAKKHRDFTVMETGWSKLDPLYQNHEAYRQERDRLLSESGREKLILYAPTFSPSLTSAVTAQKEIFHLASQDDIYVMIKFHDLMDTQVVNEYKTAAKQVDNVSVVEDRNILKYLIMADMMISDTSSVVYEFILLNKPVVTIRSTAETINWRDIPAAEGLTDAVRHELTHDEFRNARLNTIRMYHPYTDGKSSERMIEATQQYIERFGVPEKRKLNLYRRYKINKMFGSKPD